MSFPGAFGTPPFPAPAPPAWPHTLRSLPNVREAPDTAAHSEATVLSSLGLWVAQASALSHVQSLSGSWGYLRTCRAVLIQAPSPASHPRRQPCPHGHSQRCHSRCPPQPRSDKMRLPRSPHAFPGLTDALNAPCAAPSGKCSSPGTHWRVSCSCRLRGSTHPKWKATALHLLSRMFVIVYTLLK